MRQMPKTLNPCTVCSGEAMQAVNREINYWKFADPFMLSPLPNLRLSLVSMVTKKMTHFDSFTTYHTHLDLAFMILLTTVYVKLNILP